MSKKVKMKVNGMHCQGCANKIINGVNAINKGQPKTLIDVGAGMVQIDFEADLTLAEIKSKISEVGFSVENVELE